MVDYTEAIKRPFSDFKKLLIGWLFSVLPIVNLVAFGYHLECGRKPGKLPEWKNYGELFIRGLLSVVIWLIYGIPVMIVFFFVVGRALFDIVNLNEFNPEVFLSELIKTIGTSMIIIILIGALVAYVGYFAIIRYAMSYKFKEAFDFSNIFKGAFTKEYFFGWLVAIIYSTILGFIGTLIPFIGSAITGFISGVTFLTIIGSVYKEIK